MLIGCRFIDVLYIPQAEEMVIFISKFLGVKVQRFFKNQHMKTSLLPYQVHKTVVFESFALATQNV
jgi:hypothetical protein